ncbi:MAG: hypothetical protein OEZ51_15010 [Nitrospinota bacterium]|nr:hypothetical protein [Nitrospinota bacterium]
MVDTNIFNRILDDSLNLNMFKSPNKIFFATHIQKDEIVNTPNINRRNDLLSIFNEISKLVSTESGLYGISRYGTGRYSSDGLVKKIRMELDKKDKRKNNPKDALIADTAIKNNYILVTEDGPLYYVVTEIFKGVAQKLDEFLDSS